MQVFNLSPAINELTKWNPRVLDVGWHENLAPPLDRLCSVCRALDSWLQADHQHVAVLHSRLIFFICLFLCQSSNVFLPVSGAVLTGWQSSLQLTMSTHHCVPIKTNPWTNSQCADFSASVLPPCRLPPTNAMCSTSRNCCRAGFRSIQAPSTSTTSPSSGCLRSSSVADAVSSSR